MKSLTLLLLLAAVPIRAEGILGPDTRIHSDVLDYDLQYRVYLPAGVDNAQDLSVLYVTDGPGYISEGKMPRVLNQMIADGEIDPVVVVFVDARDPDRLSRNRRNSQFLCNAEYLDFYVTELIPHIEETHPVGRGRDDRGILGLSFGGTNAACFGLLGSETFSLVGMHSPANHPIKGLLPAYEEMEKLPLKMFLSTGKPDDNTSANRRFRRVLEKKGYELNYIEVREGHNWDNWRPLVDDVLLYFYPPRELEAGDM